MRKAFTLIEVLVVIAIVAILAAILMPVIAQAKEAAKKSVCLDHQRRIASSALLYVGDNEDRFPPAANIISPKQPDTRPRLVSVFDCLAPYAKSLKVFECPSGKPGTDWKGLVEHASPGTLTAYGSLRWTSYLPNLGLFGENFCSQYIPDSMRIMTQPATQSLIPWVADTVMFFEGYARKTSSMAYWNFVGMARHSRGLVLNFVDGHSRFFKYSGIPTGGSTAGVPSAIRSTYYSWNAGKLLDSEAELDAWPARESRTYNDFHGIPGTHVTDAESTACP